MSATLPDTRTRLRRLPAAALAGPSVVVGPAARWQWPALRAALIAADVSLVLLAFGAAYVVRFKLALPVFQMEFGPDAGFYAMLAAGLGLLWLAGFSLHGLYDRRNLLGGTEEYARILRASNSGLVVTVIVSFLVPELVIARGWLILAWCLSILFVAAGRFGLRRAVYGLRRRGWFLSPAVIVGANQEGLTLAQQLQASKTSGLSIVGLIDQKAPPGTTLGPGLPILGSIDCLPAVIEQYRVEEVILAASAVSVRDHLLALFERFGVAGQVNLRLSSGLYEIFTTGLTVREFGEVQLVQVNKVRLTGLNAALKSLVDYACLAPILLLSLPLMAVIGAAVRLDSAGPVLYRRRVMGVNGRQFDALKFRTMHVNGDEILAAHPALCAELAARRKLTADPRVTRLGRFLRRTSLDELPQFFNVLRGEMSLVGPRMISPEEMALYDRWGLNLLTVKPGITGLWQVSGRSNVTYAERVQLDMYYIRNWSVWLDLQLLWRTVPAVLRGTGAY